MELTQQQQRALDTARRVLAEEAAGELPPGLRPEQAAAYWRGALREALRGVAEAFPEGDQE